jgi:hypothetical protein
MEDSTVQPERNSAAKVSLLEQIASGARRLPILLLQQLIHELACHEWLRADEPLYFPFCTF